MIKFIKNKLEKFSELKREAEEEERFDWVSEEEDTIAEERNKDFRVLPKWRQMSKRRRRLLLIGVGCLLLMAVLLFFYLHVGNSYSLLREEERTDISGTTYVEYGDYLLKYSSDGVSCMTGDGSVLWKSTFSMQSPIADIYGTTAAIADKNETQIYVFDAEGQLGQFQTPLPIEKIRVAKQGVVAAVLNDGDITWINFYDTQGNEIAKNRTSLADSGYPLDIALSPDGMKIMVSYLRVTQGIMNTKVCFYNFDSVGQAEVNNMVASEVYENSVAPEVLFMDETTSVVFLNNGFRIFQGKQIPEQKKEVEFEEEILSAFHEDDMFGFVFRSDKEKHKYKALLYNKSGKQVTKLYFDLDYKKVKLAKNSLIFFNDKSFEVYNTKGRKKFSGSFDKAILDIVKMEGFRKYMVLSQNKMSVIRLK